MSFLDWIFGIETGDFKRKERKRVNFDGLDEWIKEEKERESKKILNEVKEPLEALKECLVDIEFQLDLISEKNCPETVPERFKKIIANSKPKYLKDMKALLADASCKDFRGYQELHVYSQKLTRILEDLAKINFGEGRYLTLAYGEEMEVIQKKAKILQDEKEKIKAKIGENKVILKIQAIEEKVKEVRELTAQAEEAKSHARESEEKIRKLAERQKKLAHEIRVLDEGEEMKMLAKKKNALEDKNSEAESIKTIIHSNLRALDRIMKRYRKQCPEELVDVLEGVLRDPVSYYLNDFDGKTEKLLDVMLEALDSRLIDLKDLDKAADKIRETKKRISPQMRENYGRLEVEVKSLSQELNLSGVVERKRMLSGEKTLVDSECASIIKEKEMTSLKADALKSNAADLIGGLKLMLSEDFNVDLNCDSLR